MHAGVTGRDLVRATWVRIARSVRIPHSVEDVALAKSPDRASCRLVSGVDSCLPRQQRRRAARQRRRAFSTNVMMFGICYWEVDLGGRRSAHAGFDERRPMRTRPDFRCSPRPTAPRRLPRNGSPGLLDHLYVSFANVVGVFPPTRCR